MPTPLSTASGSTAAVHDEATLDSLWLAARGFFLCVEALPAIGRLLPGDSTSSINKRIAIIIAGIDISGDLVEVFQRRCESDGLVHRGPQLAV